jgi:glutamate-5-semialdehyde dehydrogenase
MSIQDKALAAKKAAIALATLSGDLKNQALLAIAKALSARMAEIAAANDQDMSRSEAEGLAGPILKRLKFGPDKIQGVIDGIHSLIQLDEPVGRQQLATELDQGLELYKVSCPIGVIGVIFESRPDALVQIATLCLKSSNAVLLKGGSEALLTNRILAEIIADATQDLVPAGWIQLVETRADVSEMFTMNHLIDLLIPRGSNAFVQHIMNNSAIPVLGHADGVCHIYIHKDADSAKIVPIVIDAKTQYVAACNTIENLLIHTDVAARELPALVDALQNAKVELVGCERTVALTGIPAATPEDWDTEYVDYKLAIQIVDSLDQAVDFINTHGSGHTDSILTEDPATAESFMNQVDSACVFHNCSTRFADGFRFGFGAEVGISTSKIHARGPVGLDGLLIYKYKLRGSGQIVHTYSSGERSYTHRPL